VILEQHRSHAVTASHPRRLERVDRSGDAVGRRVHVNVDDAFELRGN
jgi:hypothetical protein